MVEYQKLVDDMFVATKGYIERCFDTVRARFVEVEKRIAAIPAGAKGDPGIAGTPGKDGVDGKSVELADVVAAVAPGIDKALADAVKALPVPLNGAEGPPGERGLPGESVVGPPGERGDKGLDGINGKDGAPGDRGMQGEPGPMGPQGPAGMDGEDGDDGAMGPQGPQGCAGSMGQMGDKGIDGVQGSNGVDGRDGRDGLKGDPGRDALHIDVLPAVDLAKSYPRGTFARHRGGLIRSFRDTTPIGDGAIETAGWEVAIEGVCAVECAGDARNFTVRTVLTSGKATELAFAVPAMIYRDVWKPGTYEHGDVVTRDGSTWHCNETTEAQPGDPAGAKAWTLAVKRGRDGKDGVLKEPSEPGPVRLR